MPQISVPTGTVTFLFTDIEGSTRMWDEKGDIMQTALARHDEIMREVMEAARGYVFKTIGDAFCVAFSTATECVLAAINAQIALSSETWPEGCHMSVRMAIHTGAVESRDNDYFGPPLNRVARLLATGHGGQILLTQTTYDLVRDHLPEHSSIKDLGSHQLKDLARTEQVFQVTHPKLATDFPPLKSLSNLPNNLPQQLTSFIGRERELVEILSLMEGHRLVTLLGAGGTGKTRLSLECSAQLIEQFPDGVWFIELAPITDSANIASTIISIFNVAEQSGSSSFELLIQHLKRKSMLLVIDNCEHLLDEVARTADAILRQCSDVRMLASSREAMNIPGEQTYRVPSLALPDPKQIHTSESLSHYESVRLFIDRATLTYKDFEVTNQNAPALASICLHLDGIPLAIELAAARVRSMSLEELDKRLDQRFKILTTGSRTALPRQQTLRALIDWSYDLLNDIEKEMLQRTSVFVGGWNLAAAEAVCNGEPIEEWEVLDIMASLVDKSLVNVLPMPEGSRYTMLETVRSYAVDRLTESGNQSQRRHRHLEYFSEIAEESRIAFANHKQRQSLLLIDQDQDNVRAALEFGRESKSEFALKLIGSMWQYWFLRAHLREGKQWTDSILENARDTDPPKLLGRAYFTSAILAMAMDENETYLKYLLRAQDIVRDEALFDLHGSIYNSLGIAYGRLGIAELEEASFLKAIEISTALGDKNACAKVIGNMATRSNSDDSVKLLEQALNHYEDVGDEHGIAVVAGNLAVIATERGTFELARKWLKRSFLIRCALAEIAAIAGSLEAMANLLMQDSPDPANAASAAKCLAFAKKIREDTGFVDAAVTMSHSLEGVEKIRLILGQEQYDLEQSQGRRMTLEQISEIVMNA